VPPRLAPVGKQLLPRSTASDSWRHSLRAGLSYSLPGQACPNAREGSRLDADKGLNFNAD